PSDVAPVLAEDGTRAPRCFSVAETRPLSFCTRPAQGERTSRGVWCRPVGAPAWATTSAHVAAGQRCGHPPGGKQAKKPLRGYLCPLTTGGLIRVRRRWCCITSSPAVPRSVHAPALRAPVLANGRRSVPPFPGSAGCLTPGGWRLRAGAP